RHPLRADPLPGRPHIHETGSEDPMTHHADPRILLAEPDDATRLFLTDNLAADGYEVQAVVDRDAALDQLLDGDPDLILVDVNGDTLGLLDALRAGQAPRGAVPADCPAIALTSRADELHRVRLLERGADDVVAKPFSYPELRARIAAVLRRVSPREPRPTITAGPIRIDVHRRQVTVNGQQTAPLSAVEFQLLCALARDPSRVYTRAELLRDVWDHRGGWSTRTVDSHVISSPETAVVYVDCGFCPVRRRRFISSGVVSALAAGLSPEGEAPWRGRCAPAGHPTSLDHGVLAHRPTRLAAGQAGGVDGARRRWRGGRAGGRVPAVSAPDRALAEHGARLCA
ncbi:MAG: response regulator transcription factor, partial [Solirubrobacteraceae bacterium]